MLVDAVEIPHHRAGAVEVLVARPAVWVRCDDETCNTQQIGRGGEQPLQYANSFRVVVPSRGFALHAADQHDLARAVGGTGCSLIDEIVERPAEPRRIVMQTLRQVLHHQDRDQLFLGIDREPCRRRAAPAELPHRAELAAPHGIEYDIAAETEAFAVVELVHRRRERQLVRHHELHGLAAENPYSVELAAVQQHLAKACVVVSGRVEAARTARIALQPVAECLRPATCLDEATGLVCRCHLDDARALLGRHTEIGIDHAQRNEHALADKFVERRGRCDFDHAGEHFGVHAVVAEARTGFVRERQRCEASRIGGKRRQLVQTRVVQAVDGGTAQLLARCEARRVREQVPDRDGLAGELGYEAADGIVELQPAFLQQQQRRHRGDRFGHRIDLEDCVDPHRVVARRVAIPDGLTLHDIAAMDDEGDRTRVLPPIDSALQKARGLIEIASPRHRHGRAARDERCEEHGGGFSHGWQPVAAPAGEKPRRTIFRQ